MIALRPDGRRAANARTRDMPASYYFLEIKCELVQLLNLYQVSHLANHTQDLGSGFHFL